MYSSLHARITTIAEEDNEREDRIGRSLPTRLRIYLTGGHIIDDCALIDGVNSVDDRTIDVTTATDDFQSWWIVSLDQIVAIHCRYPNEEGAPAEAGAPSPSSEPPVPAGGGQAASDPDRGAFPAGPTEDTHG